jgi:hypothetical protein
MNVRPKMRDTSRRGIVFAEVHAVAIRSGSARPSGSVTLTDPSA